MVGVRTGKVAEIPVGDAVGLLVDVGEASPAVSVRAAPAVCATRVPTNSGGAWLAKGKSPGRLQLIARMASRPAIRARESGVLVKVLSPRGRLPTQLVTEHGSRRSRGRNMIARDGERIP